MARYVKRLVGALPAPTRNSIGTDVRKDLYILMPMGQATIEQVASGRGMTVRTLQRRLEEAGETFSDALNAVRRDLAPRYMQNAQYSLQVVGRLLGFSSPSSFSRWFGGEFGTSPREWRKDHRQRG
jgi:AraC-like DNA-binding protein